MQNNNEIQKNIEKYLNNHLDKDLLNIFTCGSVDDGKSTLIGRILHDTNLIFNDQIQKICKNKTKQKKENYDANELDLASLLDRLEAEREQGITIDVAYRYFTTAKKKIIMADTPGHAQYTRNMVTGASTADIAIILIDAKNGILTQTKRHSFIASLLGIEHLIVAVNKMDLIDYNFDEFLKIKNSYQDVANKLKIKNIYFVPISALHGDNVVNKSSKMPWYQGSAILDLAQEIKIDSKEDDNFRFSVQYVSRPNSNFRGFCAKIDSGSIKVGDEILALPSKKKSKIKEIVTFNKNLESCSKNLCPTLVLEDEIDLSRGDMIVKPKNLPIIAKTISAHIVWFDDQNKMQIGKEYYLKINSKTTTACVLKIEHKIDIESFSNKSAKSLELNEIAKVEINCFEEIIFDKYEQNKNTGSFILIDKLSNMTVAAGMILDQIKTSNNNNIIKKYDEFDKNLNKLIRQKYPEWNAKNICDE